mgnify:FL=1
MRTVRKGMFGTTSTINTSTDFDIGICLRDTRKTNRYTIKQLAKELEVSEETIQAWGDGLSLPSDRFLDEMVKLYDVSKKYLLGLEEKKK